MWPSSFILFYELSCALVSNCFVIFQGCERQVADAERDGSEDRVNDCIMRLSWALVHSRQPEDVQRGIAMLEGEFNCFPYLKST